jgi:hypothetical protein
MKRISLKGKLEIIKKHIYTKEDFVEFFFKIEN